MKHREKESVSLVAIDPAVSPKKRVEESFPFKYRISTVEDGDDQKRYCGQGSVSWILLSTTATMNLEDLHITDHHLQVIELPAFRVSQPASQPTSFIRLSLVSFSLGVLFSG